MAVRIKRSDPLAGIEDAGTIRSHIEVLRDKDEEYQVRHHSAGWLAGCATVFKANAKRKAAAEYIMKEVLTFRTGGHDV